MSLKREIEIKLFVEFDLLLIISTYLSDTDLWALIFIDKCFYLSIELIFDLNIDHRLGLLGLLGLLDFNLLLVNTISNYRENTLHVFFDSFANAQCHTSSHIERIIELNLIEVKFFNRCRIEDLGKDIIQHSIQRTEFAVEVEFDICCFSKHDISNRFRRMRP